MKNPGDTVQLYCNNCLGERRHTTMFSKEQRYDEDDGDSCYFEHHEYILAECNGCEYITLAINTDSNAAGGTYTTQYPPQTIRREPQWMIHLLMSDSITNPYKYDFIREIYIALRNNTPRLAVIGIRALLEQIMVEKVGDNRTFRDNLDKFEAGGLISKIQRQSVEPLLEAGHASVHRGFKATREEVIYLMDVLENLIESIYINQEKAAKLKIPPRPPKKA